VKENLFIVLAIVSAVTLNRRFNIALAYV